MKQFFSIALFSFFFVVVASPFDCKPYPPKDDFKSYDIRYDIGSDIALHAESDAGVEAGLEDGDGCFIDESDVAADESCCLMDDQ